MKIIDLILIILSFLLLAAFIVFIIYIFVKYGNMPIDEVPSWVHWIMWRR
jgi:hypothetical protein